MQKVCKKYAKKLIPVIDALHPFFLYLLYKLFYLIVKGYLDGEVLNTKSLIKNPLTGKPLQVRLNALDRLVMAISPKAGAERMRIRAALAFFEDTGYVVAGGQKRSVRGWNVNPRSADLEVLPKLETARASSRDLWMNTALANGALKRVTTSAVGSGLLLQSRVDRELLGLSDEEASKWERNTEREFALWSTNKICDSARTLNFSELQRLALLSTLMNGDCFVLLPYLPNDYFPYDLRIQLIEADQVRNPGNAIDTERCAGGIEIDEYGAPKYLHVNKSMNKDVPLGTTINYGGNMTKIPFFGEESGRTNILHLFEPDRINQRRAMPYLAPIFEKLKQATRLSDAQLMAHIIASFFTVIIKSASNVNVLQNGFIPEQKVTNPNNEADSKIYEMAHGNFIQLDEGDEVDFADPNRSSQNFEPYFDSVIKEIGCSLEIPFEVLMLLFKSSYSASRASLQEAWKFFFQRRTWLATNFCQPIYEEWLTEAIMKKRISARGFFDDPIYKMAWCGTAWSGIKMASIDPLKEVKEKVLKVKYRLACHEDVYASDTGTGDWEGSMDRLAREEKLLDEKGLKVEEGGKDNDGLNKDEGTDANAE